MDFDKIGENIPLIFTVIGLIFLQFFLRRGRKPAVRNQEVAEDLLLEVKINQALVETFPLRQKPKRFRATSWQMNKNKLDFLRQSLQIALSDAFTMIEDYNQQMEALKKYKSASDVVQINVGKLEEPLAKSKEGLEEWLMITTGKREPSPKYPGIFDDWFGGRK